MLWFRLYHELLDDRKVQSLPSERFKQYINLMCLANLSEPRGSLPCVEDVAFRLRLDEDAAEEMLAFFLAKGFIDVDAEKTRSIHGWENRQKKSDNVTARVQEHRAKDSRAVTDDGICSNVSETLPERSGNSLEKSREDTEQEEKGTEVNMAPVARVREPDLLFEAVVDVCYHKPHTEITDSEKGRVNKALPELRKAKATPQDVYQRAAEYEQRSPGYALTPQTLTGSWSDLAIPRLAARASPKHGGARNGEKNGNDWAREIAEEESRERARSQETDRRHRSDLAELPAW